MAPREPIEKDMVDGLREVRKGLMTLNKTLVSIAEGLDERMDALEADLIGYRRERLQEEIESHQLAVQKKSSALEQTENGHSTQKVRAIASEEVKAQLEEKKIDWGKIWRNNVVPGMATTLSIMLVVALLAILFPNVIIPALQKAFGGP
jgi:uncharacterized protein YhaN